MGNSSESVDEADSEGVPKFFRWLSERYPTISQLITENRIPEFDCLYLDMNGIIHNSTHKDSDSATHRMTEDQMFIAIFNYIEHLFGTIKPKKLFFMAIDGVAPRAKMNQQRSRRFRTALDAEKAREKALSDGLEMPKEPPFDSNCITPGTEFMAKLSNQLKYFVSKKVSEDSDWQDVEIVLSGHEVPGEGEHKIMEYIRQAKSQPAYDPNVRHCLYGLDADLIMLGLLSHDPHFCLLREEVTFGRQNKKSTELEHMNFYLMHLCVVREYLEAEFEQLKEPGLLRFGYNLERIIDDFILMAFFVGNDFLPNLPHLHINEGALSLMFDTYKIILPQLDGYINDGGTIHLQRLKALLDQLSTVEYRFFEAENQDASWLKSKQRQEEDFTANNNQRGKLTMSSSQKTLWQTIKTWVNSPSSSLDLPVQLPARDREFVKSLADALHVKWETAEDETGQRHLRLSPPPPIHQEDEEGLDAVFRVTKRYDNAKVVELSPENAREELEKKYQEKFVNWRDAYYKTKFTWGLENEQELKSLTENYVQGLQWVLYYYYRGIVSWPWFFQYHYSPMISDVKKGLGADLNFKLGQPFRPFQQLMGVLPDRSKSIVPSVYHDLMTSQDSPIIDFYPRDFDLDMNGKKMEWEAVVKIPFIDERRLLDAMHTRDLMLSDAEKARNEYGVSLKFTYSSLVDYTYPSSMPGIFNEIRNCRCVENIFELPTMDGLDVFVGLIEGVKLGPAALAGFPSLKTLEVSTTLAHHGVNVFQQDSRNQSMIVTILGAESATKIENAKARLGKVVHVGYPFLQEAKIVKVSDELFDYVLENGSVTYREHDSREIDEFNKKANSIETTYSKRLGIITGTVESLVHVDMLKGLRKTDSGATVKEYVRIENMDTQYATQTLVDEVISADERFLEKAALPVEEEFPTQSRAFFLGELAYGRPLQVTGYDGIGKLKVMVAMSKTRPDDSWARRIVRQAESRAPYTPSYAVAKTLSLNPLALSKITSALSINSGGLKLNLGLNLKFEKKQLKVLGFSRKAPTGWEFSQEAVNLIVQYMTLFPEFIAGIQRNPRGDLYQDTDFYPENASVKIKEIGKWLKSVETKSFERVPLDAEQLDSNTCHAIEQNADRINAAAEERTNKTLSGVPRHALLKPSDAEHRLGQQKFIVGDRVTYVQDSGKVPVGLSGTVVGLTHTSRVTLLDLVMDSAFMSGTTLGDRCSPFRGATVPASSVLNLTERQVLAETKAAAARSHQQSKPIYSNGHGNGGYAPAATPAPLQGTWRDAIQTRGKQSNLPIRPGQLISSNTGPPPAPRLGRGTARGNLRGYTIVDNSDPIAGVVRDNPQFRPQSYNNVPPPSNINGRGAGRGRGSYPRGRGTSVRGRGAARGELQTQT